MVRRIYRGLDGDDFSALALDYFFISPVLSIEMDSHALVRLCVFLIVSVVTNYLTNARRRAEEELRQAHAKLEDSGPRTNRRTSSSRPPPIGSSPLWARTGSCSISPSGWRRPRSATTTSSSAGCTPTSTSTPASSIAPSASPRTCSPRCSPWAGCPAGSRSGRR